MKSAEQIKGAVKSIAKKMNLKPQEVLQIFMFERLVERLSISKYKENGYGYNHSRSPYDRGRDGKNNKRDSCS